MKNILYIFFTKKFVYVIFQIHQPTFFFPVNIKSYIIARNLIIDLPVTPCPRPRLVYNTVDRKVSGEKRGKKSEKRDRKWCLEVTDTV